MIELPANEIISIALNIIHFLNQKGYKLINNLQLYV